MFGGSVGELVGDMVMLGEVDVMGVGVCVVVGVFCVGVGVFCDVLGVVDGLVDVVLVFRCLCLFLFI